MSKRNKRTIPSPRTLADGTRTRQQSFDKRGWPTRFEEWAYWADTKRLQKPDGSGYREATEGLAVGYVPGHRRVRLYMRTRLSKRGEDGDVIGGIQELGVFSRESTAIRFIEWMKRWDNR